MTFYDISQPVDQTTKDILAKRGKITLEFDANTPYGEITSYLSEHFPHPLYRWGFRRVGINRRSVNVIEALASLSHE